MSKVYKIEIQEVLSKVVKIKANSLDEAIDIAQERYKKEEYVLDYKDLVSVDIGEYDDLTKQKDIAVR